MAFFGATASGDPHYGLQLVGTAAFRSRPVRQKARSGQVGQKHDARKQHRQRQPEVAVRQNRSQHASSRTPRSIPAPSFDALSTVRFLQCIVIVAFSGRSAEDEPASIVYSPGCTFQA